MPRKPIDYRKTYFYKLVCNDINVKDMYIGHTTEFTKRKHEHKKRCCNPTNPKHHFYVYEVIRQNGHWENWDMILIDTITCENRLDALKKERDLYEMLKPSLNTFRPVRTEDERLNYHKEHYHKNIESIAERHKKYRDEHAEECKKDRKNNPEKYRKLDRQRYLKRRDKVLEDNKQTLECYCGSTITMGYKTEHEKTKKHQTYINSLQD